MKNIISFFILYFGLFFIATVPYSASAQFIPLIPGLAPTPGDMSGYLEQLFILTISIAALIAVGKIIIAGIKYITSGIVTEKSGAKKDIQNALIGLLIILIAVALLRTINPGLANLPALTPAGDLVDWTVVSDSQPISICTGENKKLVRDAETGVDECITIIDIPGDEDYRDNPGEGRAFCLPLAYNTITNTCEDTSVASNPIPENIIQGWEDEELYGDDLKYAGNSYCGDLFRASTPIFDPVRIRCVSAE